MAEMTKTPSVTPNEIPFKQLRQVTIELDERIEEVNQLLADGWQLITIGQTAHATIYVLGRTDEKPRRGAGFVPNDRQGVV